MIYKPLPKKILEKISHDEWIPASKIAKSLGIRTQLVGQIIHYSLLNKYVERKELNSKRKIYLYRQIKPISEILSS